MTSYVSVELRRLVTARAEGLCEYCLIHEDDTYLGCQVDHIIAEKHGGPTQQDNLAYACTFCNRSKGADLASILPVSGELVRLFNPRSDHWGDHFSLADGWIHGQTSIGIVTARTLGFNHPQRILERSSLINLGRYPHPASAARISPREG